MSNSHLLILGGALALVLSGGGCDARPESPSQGRQRWLACERAIGARVSAESRQLVSRFAAEFDNVCLADRPLHETLCRSRFRTDYERASTVVQQNPQIAECRDLPQGGLGGTSTQ